MEYSRSGVAQGRVNQSKAQEQPNTFGTESGVENVTQRSALDVPKQRMAGKIPHRVLEYLSDPDETRRTDTWMELFSTSVPGAEFKQVKMNGGLPPEGQ